MDEVESKLTSSSPAVVAQIFSKIVQNIKQKHKDDTKEVPEVKFLKEKCISPDPLISDVATSVLINLVEDGLLAIEPAIADFITTIPLTKCYSSLTKIIGSLLYLELKRKCSDNKRTLYNLYLPQHPFITILIENPGSWNCIFNEIRFLYVNKDRNYVTELFRPVYLYTLFNPDHNNLLLLKQKFFTLLLNDCGQKDNIFYDMLCWMHVETKNNLETNSELLIQALNYYSSPELSVNLEVLILWQTSLLYNLALNKLDIRFCIYNLKNVLLKEDNLVTVDCLLLLLTKTIEVCSPNYLHDLLTLCKHLLSYHGKNIYILEALKASLLQWVVFPSMLTTQANSVANTMLTYIDNHKPTNGTEGALEEFYTQYKTVLNANSNIFESIQVCLLVSQFSDENRVIEWLDRVKNFSPTLISKLYHLLCGFFLAKCSSGDISANSFSLILSFVEQNKLLTPQLLTLILYKLSNTKDPKLHFTMLKALPKMVVLRENIPKVMATLQALSQGSVDMYNFGLSLMFDSWKLEPKCYSYLENMLVLYNVSKKKWETYVIKAFILKELCERKPELYGKDMVAHLSKVLNDCNDADGSLPCALAIDGIKSLCKAEIIDIVTTWATLWPKFKNDTRTPVIKSLCLLIHEIPHLPYAESYTELKEDVIRTLWGYIDVDDPQIKEAALNSLTSFSFEEICAHLPVKYLDENIMQERQKTGVGSPQLVPGHVWVKFLSENGASKGVCNFVTKLISIEISNYLRYVYQVKGTREPMNHAYLPTHSIVRGITDFIRTWVNKWKNTIDEILYIECLKILSQEYSKPLPPLDWCFLQELLHEPKVKNFCIDIACHQVILSGTARRLVENYIAAVAENPQEIDILNITKNLKHLANSIQPIILKPFFEKAIEFAIDSYNDEYEEKLLEKISKHIVEVLRSGDIQETNKMTIAQVLSDKISVTNTRSELFEIFLQCVAALPTKCLQEITNKKNEISEEWLEKVIKIRCTAALQTKIAPLTWLNDVIEVSSTMKRNLDTSSELISVFRKHSNNGAECALWLLDLIGQIQAKVADRCDEKEVLYFFDIFILSVVEFSGYSVFITEQTTDYDVAVKKLFPQAFYALMSMNHWSICTNQALEWMYHVNTEETLPFDYRNLFGLTLQALRHDDEFKKNLRWMKYLSSSVVHDIS